MATMIQTHHDDSNDYDDYDDYEYNYKQRHTQGLCPCAGGNSHYIQNKDCVNYQCYGYNCVGIRVESDGRVLSAPFGFGEKEYEIGPDFGENYTETHQDEFEGVILKERYNPGEIFEYHYAEYEDDSNTAYTSTDDDVVNSEDSNSDFGGYDSV